ncbi:MAG: COX15/CtaA family protein [Rhizobacter sp.]
MAGPALYNFNPLLVLAALCLLLGAMPLAWIWFRHRHAMPTVRLRALTLFTLFLTFDLVVFGAFTRLTDSGLGCPDWPGCYGSASPLGAHADIHAAQTAMPTGPVTHGKAWVEMVHRYLATVVGMLIVVLAAASWWARQRGHAVVSPWWATATLVWVCVQGAFGALTVTMKLYPAIVTAHLLGGLGLLVLLAVQSQGHERTPLRLSRGLQAGTWALFVLVLIQITLGGWVSTNYAVLACTDFPTCQGQWWPSMDFDHGFTVLRELGVGKDGGFLPFAALTAIHVTHRIGAGVVLLAMLVLVWRLYASSELAQQRWACALAVVALWQFASGLSNVVLGWPLVAALAHTAGAAALITLLAVMLARARLAQTAS